VCGVTVDIGRFGAYVMPYVVRPAAAGETGSLGWLTYPTSGYGMIGVLNEVVVFNRKLTENERQQVYGYLARKYKMQESLPDSYTLSHNGAYSVGMTYWMIEHHPNTKNTSTIPAGLSFSGITLNNFFYLPETVYKSKGTVLSDGTVLSGDTYSNIGL
jgi:hypothetical protein